MTRLVAVGSLVTIAAAVVVGHVANADSIATVAFVGAAIIMPRTRRLKPAD